MKGIIALLAKWEPKDVLALVVIVGALYLLGTGVDSFVGWTLVGIVFSYYGIDLTPWVKLGRNQKGKKEN